MTTRTVTFSQFHKALFVAAALVMVLLLASCAKEGSGEVKYLIGVAHADLSEDWQLALDVEIREQIDKYEVVEVITTNANGSTFKQMKDLQTLMEYGIDLLIVTPNDAVVMRREIRKVYAEIPVIVMNREIIESDYTMFIGPDYYDIGSTIGEKAAAYAQDEVANVVEIKGPFNDASVNDMTKGFNEVIKESEYLNRYGEFAADWKKDDAMDWYMTYQQYYPDGDLLFSHNLAMAQGVWEAETTVGSARMAYFTTEAISNNIEEMRSAFDNGYVSIVAWQLGGVEAVDYAVDILDGNQDIPKSIVLNDYELNQDNIDQFANMKVSQEKSEIKHLGIVQSGVGLWDMTETESLEKAAQSDNIELSKVIVDPRISVQNQQLEQIEAIYSLMDEGVDAVILSPVKKDGWDEVLEAARYREIPLVVINNPADGLTSSNMFIGYDGYREGALMARWLVENLYNEEDTNIAVVGGVSYDSSHVERNRAIEEIVDDYSRIRILNDWSSGDGSLEEMNEIIETYRDEMNVLIVLDEDMIDLALDAVDDQRLIAGKDVKVLCFGDDNAYEKYLNNGGITCMVTRHPQIGHMILESIHKMMNSLYFPKAIYNANEVVWYTTPF